MKNIHSANRSIVINVVVPILAKEVTGDDMPVVGPIAVQTRVPFTILMPTIFAARTRGRNKGKSCSRIV